MQFRFLLPVTALIISSAAYSQVNNYRKNDVKWDTIKCKTIPVHPSFTKNDAVILNEHLSIKYVDMDRVFITKVMQVKIQSQKGVDYFQGFYFPENVDPLTDRYSNSSLKDKNIPPICFPKYEITHCAARKINGNNASVPMKVESSEQTVRISDETDAINLFIYRFSVPELKVGDEIQFVYRMAVDEGIYLRLMSRRIFFSGPFPKMHTTYEFRCEQPNIFLNFTQVNGAEKHLKATEQLGGKQYYRWEFDNLDAFPPDGYLHPAQQLPFVYSYYSIGRDHHQLNKKNWKEMIHVSLGDFEFKENNDVHFNDAGTLGIDKFFGKYRDSVNNRPANTMNSIHNAIVRTMKYYTLEDRKEKEEFYLKSGELLQKGLFYGSSGYLLYNEFLKRTGKEYFAVHLPDKRKEYLDTSRYVKFSNYLYCYMLNDSGGTYYYIPKNSPGGYFVSEFPFYYEDVIALYSKITGTKDKNAKLGILKTPGSTAADNLRQTSYDVKVDSAWSTVVFNGKLSLSGQFSTLIRDSYLHNSADGTVNPRYYRKPFPVANKILNRSEKFVSLDPNFPFKCSFDLGFTSTDMVDPSGDDRVLDLSGIMNHVYWDSVNVSDTVMSFHYDFRFKDVYRFRIAVPANYKCVNLQDFNVRVKNDYGKYEMKLMELKPGELVMESSFLSETEVAPANRKSFVKELFDVVKKSENAKLLFRKQ